MTKVIPIKFNNEVLKEIERAEELLGLTNTYGSTAKVVKFGISLIVSALENPDKVYFGFDQEKLDMWFKSRARVEKERKQQELIKKLYRNDEKV